MTADTRLAEKLAELGLSMPPAPAAKGVYRPLVVVDRLVYASGHLSVRPDGQLVTGRVGQGLDVTAGYAAARLAAWGSWPRSRRSSARSADPPPGQAVRRRLVYAGVHPTSGRGERRQRAVGPRAGSRGRHWGPQRDRRGLAAAGRSR